MYHSMSLSLKYWISHWTKCKKNDVNPGNHAVIRIVCIDNQMQMGKTHVVYGSEMEGTLHMLMATGESS